MLPCHIVKDLLPSYLDHLTGPETEADIQEHLEACPDCRAALSQLQGKGTPHEFVEITANLENLKAFLNLRDQSAAFEGVKAAGGIGIPAFVREDGTVTLDPASL